MTSITPFLWFDNNVPEAVAFYGRIADKKRRRLTRARPAGRQAP
jgi:predicted 3-demethylubiquinone-9 3-methyltransferase (glyoxalase superfamily)